MRFYRRLWLTVFSDDDEDETAELQRELEKIKRERAEKREQEVRIGFPNPFICFT